MSVKSMCEVLLRTAELTPGGCVVERCSVYGQCGTMLCMISKSGQQQADIDSSREIHQPCDSSFDEDTVYASAAARLKFRQ